MPIDSEECRDELDRECLLQDPEGNDIAQKSECSMATLILSMQLRYTADQRPVGAQKCGQCYNFVKKWCNKSKVFRCKFERWLCYSIVHFVH